MVFENQPDLCEPYRTSPLVKCMGITPCQHGDCEGWLCFCAANWHGTFCNICCDEAWCGDHGTCGSGLSEEEVEVWYCRCDEGYEGAYCNETIVYPWYVVIPDNSDWKAWVTLAVVAMATTMLVMVSVLALYYTWLRGRLPPAIQRIIYYFKPNEEDDGHLYDGVLSAADADTSFVRHQLMPRLEREMGFKLWLADRNSLPGTVIAESIIEAVRASRRTILVISPSYISEEWPRFYHQVAQHEMLKSKHRIIPIILEDVKKVKDVDKDLTYILQTVPVLKWPDILSDATKTKKRRENFWEKLKLFMPKKRNSTVVKSNMSLYTIHNESFSKDCTSLSV